MFQNKTKCLNLNLFESGIFVKVMIERNALDGKTINIG